MAPERLKITGSFGMLDRPERLKSQNTHLEDMEPVRSSASTEQDGSKRPSDADEAGYGDRDRLRVCVSISLLVDHPLTRLTRCSNMAWLLEVDLSSLSS